MAINRRQRRVFPGTSGGYELFPQYGWFSILEPAAMTNLIQYPSFELGTLNAPGGALYSLTPDIPNQPDYSITTDEQRYGAYSLEITPNVDSQNRPGIQLNMEALPLTEGDVYMFSLSIKGDPSDQYEIYVDRNSGARSPSVGTFQGTGHWQRKYLAFDYDETVDPMLNIFIVRTGSNDVAFQSYHPFYIDGVMLTEGPEKSTYFDGDTVPYGKDENYIWVGNRHESYSKRAASEMSTGIIRNLTTDYGYHILGFNGLGLNAQEMTIMQNALIGGGRFLRGSDTLREYNIVGSLAHVSIKDLFVQRASILSLLKNSHTYQQPLTVLLNMVDDCGNEFAEPLKMRSLYAGGFESTVDNLNQERSTLQFTMDQPSIFVDGDEGGDLAVNQEITYNYMARRRVGYGWDDWDTGANGAIRVVKFDEGTGRVYVGGDFTSIGSTPVATNRVAYWDVESEAWTALAGVTTGANDHVLDIAVAGNGDLFVGGEFTNFNGVAANDYLVYQDGPSWSTYAVLNKVTAIAVAPNGYDIYVVECNVGGLSPLAYVHHIDHNAGTITLIGQISNAFSANQAYVYDVEVDSNGDVYIVGYFSQVSGQTAYSIARWDGSSWYYVGVSGLEAGTLAIGYQIILGEDGNFYIRGTFTTANDVSATFIAKYNGVVYSALGSGLNDAGDYFYSLKYYKGELYVPGYDADGIAISNINSLGMAVWNDTNWKHMDFYATAADDVTNIDIDNQGTIYVGGENSFTMEASDYEAVENTGTDIAYPVIYFYADTDDQPDGDKIIWIRNESTNQTIYLNLDVLPNETIVFDLRVGRKKIISNTRGNLNKFIMPSSDFANFHIVPGQNVITVYLTDVTDADVTLRSVIFWHIPHKDLSGAVY